VGPVIIMSNVLKSVDLLRMLLYFFALIIYTARISITVNGLLSGSIVLPLSRDNLVLFLMRSRPAAAACTAGLKNRPFFFKSLNTGGIRPV
jgi:hypothetical protein